MKVLIVDNKDSFTYNLKHYIHEFSDQVTVVRCNELNVDDIKYYDKILLSPGPGLPEEYPVLEEILIHYAKSKSILGICLGQQAIATFYGGKLNNLTNPMHGIISTVSHLNNCVLYKEIPVSIKVGHYHSWVVSKRNFPSQLEITSLNENGLIMSLKHRKHDVRSMQFHPESILTENGLLLLKNWLFY